MSLTIRPYRNEDLAAVAALGDSGHHEPCRSAVFVRQMGEVCKGTFLVAVLDEGNLSGTLLALVFSTMFATPGSCTWRREDQRRKGIGSALLKAVSSALQVRHACTIRLTVSRKNQPAIRLYERQGFGRERIVAAYLGRVRTGLS